ncbi:class I SAM-dependent methyltransferase [Vulcanisaeta thermophila]|uniref:class I SAM-dependent methyltransferase n=1 Tax=Vulcanisaeta thermophila TaxID=867917 RepID=UPI000853C962|nr:methyltransferase domain-containing protein [Vulcanisaeta thermophila]
MEPSLLSYKLRVKEYYEKMGRSYLELYLSESVRNYLRLAEDLRMRNARVLDVGCGLGIGASMLSGITKQYICLDIACTPLQYPSKLLGVDVVCADGALMPIRGEALDYVLIINVINAEGDGEAILKEALGISNKVFAVSPRSIDNELIRSIINNRQRIQCDDQLT